MISLFIKRLNFFFPGTKQSKLWPLNLSSSHAKFSTKVKCLEIADATLFTEKIFSDLLSDKYLPEPYLCAVY